MHYIAHLFRVVHLNGDLVRPPFSPEQIASFSRGALPEGDLGR